MNSWPKPVCIGLAVALFLALAWVVARPPGGASNDPSNEVSHAPATDDTTSHMVCVGRIEPLGGEVNVSAQMAGTLEAVTVKEGDRVEAGAPMASVDARREKAQLELAKARLTRVQAGFGAEEIATTAAQRDGVAAELSFAESELKRALKLKEQNVISDDDLDARQQRVASLTKQVASLQKQFEAMKRGPLPEEVAVARAEVEVARANYDLHQVLAPFAGTVLQLCRHTGEQILLDYPTPILRMADTSRLQVRVEVNEADVYRLNVGMEGSFTVVGVQSESGRLRVRTLLPAFGPKRLFDPDTAARVDTRTLQALCDITRTRQPVYPGQRVIMVFLPFQGKDQGAP